MVEKTTHNIVATNMGILEREGEKDKKGGKKECVCVCVCVLISWRDLSSPWFQVH